MRDHGPRGGQWLSRGEDSVHRRLSLNPDRHIRDWSSKAGATELIEIIIQFWERRGAFNVKCVAIAPKNSDLTNTGHEGTVWSIKSNMVYGRPPGSKVYD